MSDHVDVLIIGAGLSGIGAAAHLAKDLPGTTYAVLERRMGQAAQEREGLDARTRLLVTLAGLITQGAVAEPQIRLTVRHALEAGATRREIAETIFQCAMFGGLPAMQKGLELAQAVFDETGGDKE